MDASSSMRDPAQLSRRCAACSPQPSRGRTCPRGLRRTIDTPRLRLRPGRSSDSPDIISALNDWSVAQWVTSPPFPYREKDAREFLGKSRRSSGEIIYIVADRFSDRLLGVVTLEPQREWAELGYWLSPRAQHKGVMREAVSAVLQESFLCPAGPKMVYAIVDPLNTRSQAVLRSTGFDWAWVERRARPSRRGSVLAHRYEKIGMLGGIS